MTEVWNSRVAVGCKETVQSVNLFQVKFAYFSYNNVPNPWIFPEEFNGIASIILNFSQKDSLQSNNFVLLFLWGGSASATGHPATYPASQAFVEAALHPNRTAFRHRRQHAWKDCASCDYDFFPFFSMASSSPLRLSAIVWTSALGLSFKSF